MSDPKVSISGHIQFSTDRALSWGIEAGIERKINEIYSLLIGELTPLAVMQEFEKE
jgi:hypothetical protein